MTKAEILNGKTRKELACLIGIAYMNQTGSDKKAGQAVARGWLKGAGAVKPSSKSEMIEKVLNDEARGFIRIA